MKKPFHREATPNIFENAKALRKTQTYAEDLLWEHLRNRRFHGLKFRRQHPVGRYIADFYCHELSLVIEADGAVHATEEQRLCDEHRTQELNQSGICVVRFQNEEIEANVVNCLRKLEAVFCLHSEEQSHS